MKRLTTLIVIALIAVMAFGVVGSAAAQGPGNGNGNNDGGDGPNNGFPGRGGDNFGNSPRGNRGMGNHGGFGFRMDLSLFWDDADVAAALGITEAELQAYYDEGMDLRAITSELNINLQNVQEALRDISNARRDEILAGALGITVDELQAYYDNDMTLRDIAQELNVNLDNVQDALREVMQAEFNARVSEILGITADELQAYFDEGLNLREIIDELGIDIAELDLPGNFNFRDGDNRGNRGNRGNNAVPPSTDSEEATTDEATTTDAEGA